jgi:ribosome biogenesis protein MAK21
VKTLITYNETRDENDIEQFKDLNNSSDGEDISQSGEKNEIVEKIEQKSYDPFKRDPLYSNADKTCLWELISLLNHYHPYVKKYAEALIEDINKSNSIIDYNGNPLLDFNLANFLDRLTFKKTKKKESSGIKSLINKNKLRMSKIKDPLSIEEVL